MSKEKKQVHIGQSNGLTQGRPQAIIWSSSTTHIWNIPHVTSMGLRCQRFYESSFSYKKLIWKNDLNIYCFDNSTLFVRYVFDGVEMPRHVMLAKLKSMA